MCTPTLLCVMQVYIIVMLGCQCDLSAALFTGLLASPELTWTVSAVLDVRAVP